MTAILAIESGMLDETVVVSDRAIRAEGSSIYLRANEKIKLHDLVYGLMLRSESLMTLISYMTTFGLGRIHMRKLRKY